MTIARLPQITKEVGISVQFKICAPKSVGMSEETEGKILDCIKPVMVIPNMLCYNDSGSHVLLLFNAVIWGTIMHPVQPWFSKMLLLLANSNKNTPPHGQSWGRMMAAPYDSTNCLVIHKRGKQKPKEEWPVPNFKSRVVWYNVKLATLHDCWNSVPEVTSTQRQQRELPYQWFNNMT